MHIVHTVASVEAEAAGPSYTVPRLCRELAAMGEHVDLMSLGSSGARRDEGYSDIRFHRSAVGSALMRKLGVSCAMRRELLASHGDVFHTHGLWMMPNVYPALAARRWKRPFVLSPRGMLNKEALQFSQIPKRIFWAIHGPTLRRVACLHATAGHEMEDIRAFGLAQPVAVIPNGIDLPAQPVRLAPQDRSDPFVLSLGRIHPVKALDRLIRAWALVHSEFPHWRLRIVGPGEAGYIEQLQMLARELDAGQVEISGPVYGEEKTTLMAEADLFAMSTLQENFGMAVAESLAVQTPVISTKGAPWGGLEPNRCGWWVDHGPEAFAAALRQAMSLSSEDRHEMGRRGREWMRRDFGWQRVAAQMSEVYRWLTGVGSMPGCVQVG